MTRKGTQCKNSAVTGTNPPRCSIPSHQTEPDLPGAARAGTPTRKRGGAPPGNKNAEKHGGYSGTLPIDLNARIVALDRRLQHVENYLDVNADNLATEDYIKIAALQGQLLSRLDRLTRGRDDDTDAATKTEIDIDAVLQVLSTTFNIDLTGEKKE